ncbi:hypothetical protein [Natronomonas sp. EA1]|uniref:hypothetical protein n=1 Tax=Natronomonas sp. EA1 TaxID=3421655 RepID=UPI003EB7B99A
MTGERVDTETLGLPETPGFTDVDAALHAGEGTVAIVGEPFAGRATVLDHLAERAETTRHSLDPGADAPDIPDSGTLVVDDCQQLYTRRVGGFDPLDAFLVAVARSDGLVVTGWNAFSWAYLTRSRAVKPAFDAVVRLPDLDAGALAAHLDGDVEFIANPNDRLPAVVRGEWTPRVAGRSLSVPYPRINRDWLTHVRTNEGDPRDAVFERLAAESRGNPGVARAIWERSVREGRLAPAWVDAGVESPELDTIEAFTLRVVLAKELATRGELDAVTGRREVGGVLRALVRQGLVERTETGYAPTPAGLPTAARAVDRRRIP